MRGAMSHHSRESQLSMGVQEVSKEMPSAKTPSRQEVAGGGSVMGREGLKRPSKAQEDEQRGRDSKCLGYLRHTEVEMRKQEEGVDSDKQVRATRRHLVLQQPWC